MSQIAQWETNLNICTSSMEDFSLLAPEILFLLKTNDTKYSNFFYKTISQLIVSKMYEPHNRFYSLYLLFKATEKGDIATKGELSKDHELISFLYRAAGQDAHKISYDERGKKFFSINPTMVEARIGINFVRLSLECLLSWKSNYSAKKLNSNSDVLGFYMKMLLKEVKFPRCYQFIDRDYCLNQDLAMWDYGKKNPRTVSEKGRDSAGTSQSEISGIVKVKDLIKQTEPEESQESLELETEREEEIEKFIKGRITTKPSVSTAKIEKVEKIEQPIINMAKMEQETLSHIPSPTLIPIWSNTTSTSNMSATPVSPYRGSKGKCSTPISPMFRPKTSHTTYNPDLAKINKSIERSREHVYYWKPASRSGTAERAYVEDPRKGVEYGVKNLVAPPKVETEEIQTKHRPTYSEMQIVQKINSYGQKNEEEHMNLRRTRERRLKSLLNGFQVNAK